MDASASPCDTRLRFRLKTVTAPSRVYAAVVCAFSLAVLTACDSAQRPLRPPFQLLERDGYQAFYLADGHLDRVAYDANADRKADAIVFYDSRGQPERAEADVDYDGVVDHWEWMLDGGLWIEESDHDGDGKPEVCFLHGPGATVRPLPIGHPWPLGTATSPPVPDLPDPSQATVAAKPSALSP
jgi:hypothetical protein